MRVPSARLDDGGTGLTASRSSRLALVLSVSHPHCGSTLRGPRGEDAACRANVIDVA